MLRSTGLLRSFFSISLTRNFKTESANGGKFYTSIICMYTTVQMYPDTGLLLTRLNFIERLWMKKYLCWICSLLLLLLYIVNVQKNSPVESIYCSRRSLSSRCLISNLYKIFLNWLENFLLIISYNFINLSIVLDTDDSRKCWKNLLYKVLVDMHIFIYILV